jgi:hypothetical protein
VKETNMPRQSVREQIYQGAKDKVIYIQKKETPQVDIYKNIREGESEIVKQKYETAIAYDKRGNEIFRKNGEKSNVTFTDSETEKFKDTIFTHNHPTLGGSFSKEDINFACISDMQEMRAVGTEYEHSIIRPSGGWDRKYYKDIIEPEYIKADGVTREKFIKLINNGEITPNDAEKEHYNTVWNIVAEKLGLNYSRKLR